MRLVLGDLIQGSVYARQALYQLNCIPGSHLSLLLVYQTTNNLGPQSHPTIHAIRSMKAARTNMGPCANKASFIQRSDGLHMSMVHNVPSPIINHQGPTFLYYFRERKMMEFTSGVKGHCPKDCAKPRKCPSLTAAFILKYTESWPKGIGLGEPERCHF